MTDTSIINDRRAAARMAPEPERKRREGVFGIVNNQRVIVTPGRPGGPPAGSIDLCGLNYSDATKWIGAARICDVAATVDRATAQLAETIGQVLGKQLRISDQKTAAIEKRVGELAGENAQLRAEIGELRGQIVKMATAKPRIRPRASTVSSGALT